MSSSVADSLRTWDAAAVPEPSSEQLDALMREISEQPAGPRRAALRDQAIRLLLPLARRVARRFPRRGQDLDDLVQVASLGLVKAVDGYDPTRGHAFLSYALPKVTGELRRHLRDRTSAVRLPRPLQEASGQVFQAVEELEQRLGGRSPTSEQIAEYTGLEHGHVLSTLRAVHECRPRSLEEPAGHDQDYPLACLIGAEDAALSRVVDTVALASLVKQLPERERHILYLRFYEERTQQQIADVIGVSQMQVSRILRRCFDRLREALLASEPVPVRDEVQCRPKRSSYGRRRPSETKRPARPGQARPATGSTASTSRRSVRALSLRTCQVIGADVIGAGVPPGMPRPTDWTTVRRRRTARPACPVRVTCPGGIARPPPAAALAHRQCSVSPASVLVSDVPVVARHTCPDSRQPANALPSTIAYCAE